MTVPALQVDELSKAYGPVVALDEVTLRMESGEIVALLGPNGAGKTTLVSVVCGLRRADSGSVRVLDVDALAHPARARRHIGLAPQETGIYPIDTVRQNLALFGELAGVRRRRLSAEIDVVAEALGLEGLLDRPAGELSGGQKRRLHTGLALIGSPRLILLDEATVGADVGTRAALVECVKELAEHGRAVLYSTHYLHEVEALGARAVIMDRGAVIAEGTVPELIGRGARPFIELHFEGVTPTLDVPGALRPERGVLRVPVADPGLELPRVLASLGSDVRRLRRVDVVSPSLESVFLTLTGRRYDVGSSADEVDHVVVP